MPRPRPAPTPAARPAPAPEPQPGAVGAAGARPPGRGRRRQVALWSAVAVVAVAGLAGGAFFFLGDGGPDEEATAGKDTGRRPAGAEEKPVSTAPSVPQAVPLGYHLVDEKKLGVSFPVPDGWTRKEKSAVQVDYIDGSGLVGLKINVLDFASRDHLQHWKDVERQTKAENQGYKQERMQRTTFRGQPAAIWEFTFKGRARDYRAIDLGFGNEGGKEYAIYLSAPKADWDHHRPVFDVVRDGFRPKPR
ncbi:hypothetical protein ACFQ2B_11905 [Streptomyces stramineus]